MDPFDKFRLEGSRGKFQGNQSLALAPAGFQWSGGKNAGLRGLGGGLGTGQMQPVAYSLGGPDSVQIHSAACCDLRSWHCWGLDVFRRQQLKKGLDPALSIFWMRSFSFSLVSRHMD